MVAEIKGRIVRPRNVEAQGCHVGGKKAVRPAGEGDSRKVADHSHKVTLGGQKQAGAGKEGRLAVGFIAVIPQHLQANHAPHRLRAAGSGMTRAAHILRAEPRGLLAVVKHQLQPVLPHGGGA